MTRAAAVGKGQATLVLGGVGGAPAFPPRARPWPRPTEEGLSSFMGGCKAVALTHTAAGCIVADQRQRAGGVGACRIFS